MDFWTPNNIASVTGGRWQVRPTGQGALAGLNIDTRSMSAGQVFVAIEGERFDGHEFVAAAIEGGAGLIVVSREVEVAGANGPAGGVLVVRDTVEALGALAHAYRDVLGGGGTKVIAVTGSNGKTTTRHLIHTVLASELAGSQSPKSFNNQIGVPLTVLGARECDAFVVVEMGMNHRGEIATLAEMVRPDCAVITNVGRAHAGPVGGREAVAAEKGSVLRFVKDGGLAVVPWGEALLEPAIAGAAQRLFCVRVGLGAAADLRAIGVVCDAQGVRFDAAAFDSDGRETALGEIQVPLIGAHNVTNALCAVAVGRWMGVSGESIRASLALAHGVPMRLTVAELGMGAERVVILNDAYNANPDSVDAALRTLVVYPMLRADGRRVAVLGDMNELGETERDEHRAIGELVGQLAYGKDGDMGCDGIDLLVTIGPLAGLIGEAAVGADGLSSPQVVRFDKWDDGLPEAVAGLLQAGDLVLIKASRRSGLERLIPAIAGRFGGAV